MAWYVARIKPSETDRALASMKRGGFTFSYPMVKDDQPLLPGYLFAMADTDDDLADVADADGIAYLLPKGSENPSRIRDSIVTGLIARVDSGEFDNKPIPMPRYTKGEVLSIRSGAFTGYAGKFEAVKKGLVRIAFNFMGAQVKIFMPFHQVDRVSI